MKCLLYLRTGPKSFSHNSTHDDYLSALTLGQSHGHGIFTIDTKSRVPSRLTQLGLAKDDYIHQPKPLTIKRAKKNKLLNED